MESTDLALDGLKSIQHEVSAARVEISATNDRLDATNRRLDAANTRLDAINEHLGACIMESAIRTAAAVAALHGTVRDLVDLLCAQHDLRPRVEQCERDLGELKNRLGR